ncbi:MAG: hypothetical protein ABS43_29920 [Bordetella sp. SCN 67-23]|nr:CopD family protein [Burkholderiales bacterium]ODS67688.1 MAG: hypothetical protein ABS43_29920 [Bordetella sp. SCN 67-23]ODU84205.1 MAG: hypothetical protein ABT00_10125 [Bordetella sp. SCN 68-11]OJW93452.1 MAG: hypothetical protein BGO71_15865 [Burkholderiales bacterium 67-32]
MAYLWLKAAHLTALMIWIGGMLAVALVLRATSPRREELRASGALPLLGTVRRWDHYVTSPAMLLAWALGLTLAFQGGWFGQPWLWAKLILALLLAAVHGRLAGGLRKRLRDDIPVVATWRHAPGAILALVAAIVALVVVKPFA